jgi:tRNA threonylcarbamoyladenosine biosynthesis protein TsaB
VNGLLILNSMNDFLPLLAIETSDSICGACIYFDEAKYFSAKVILKHSHSEKLFEVIQSVLNQASISQNDLKAIAVSNGPGSFTGLRIGMSAAKGMAQALSIPIIPVPTFEALAFQISKYLPEETSFVISNMVGRDELYFAKFQIKGNSYIFKEELKIIPISEIILFSKSMNVFGNFENSGTNDKINLKNISAPNPEYVAEWALKFGADKIIYAIDNIEPNYIKDFIIKEKKK